MSEGLAQGPYTVAVLREETRILLEQLQAEHSDQSAGMTQLL